MPNPRTRIGTAIPILPCRSIDEQLDFYQALGFEVTYRQSKPNLYACVRHPIAELHFFVLKQLEPANSYSMCYVSVPDVDAVYQDLCDSLRKAGRKVPTKGFPKITKVNDLSEDRRFNLVDPAGNRLLIGQKHAVPKPAAQGGALAASEPGRLAQAFNTAYRLTYAKDDPATAARVLDAVLPKSEEASATLRFQASVLRADIAAAMDEIALAKEWARRAERLSSSLRSPEEAANAQDRLRELLASWEERDLRDANG